MFKDDKIAGAFARDAILCARVYTCDEDRYAMQKLADILNNALNEIIKDGTINNIKKKYIDVFTEAAMSKDIIDGDFKDFSATEISPYDSSYPIKLLQTELRNKIVKAQSAAAELYKAVTKVAPQTAQIKGALQKGCRYVRLQN